MRGENRELNLLQSIKQMILEREIGSTPESTPYGGHTHNKCLRLCVFPFDEEIPGQTESDSNVTGMLHPAKSSAGSLVPL